jgi:hypothetical protein
MRVVEAQAGWAWSKRDAPHPLRRDERRPFLSRAVHISGNRLPVPMQLLRRIRVVMHIHRRQLAFFETQQRPRELAVVGDGRDDAFRRNLNRRGADSQRIVGCAFRRGRGWSGMPGRERSRAESNAGPEKRRPRRGSRHFEKIPSGFVVIVHRIPPVSLRSQTQSEPFVLLPLYAIRDRKIKLWVPGPAPPAGAALIFSGRPSCL